MITISKLLKRSCENLTIVKHRAFEGLLQACLMKRILERSSSDADFEIFWTVRPTSNLTLAS